LPRSGNFADVYELRGPHGARWAVKCFTREVPGLRERYQEISQHLEQAQLPFMTDFRFLEQGIRVRGRWHPVLKMPWIEGLTLDEFVRQHADKPVMLEALLRIWVRMAKRLREANIAHGDLQHGNLLLVPYTSNSLLLKLIDYDGMYVPALAGHRTDEVGHPCYQHPQRLRERAYGPHVDRFPLLLIATALQAVKVAGAPLWEKYDTGDNLLFREADLQSPVKSRLFYELLKVEEPLTRWLVEQTLQALKEPLTAAPLLDELLPERLATSSEQTVGSSVTGQAGATPTEARRRAGRKRSPASATSVSAYGEAPQDEKIPPSSMVKRLVIAAVSVVFVGSGIVGITSLIARRASTPVVPDRSKQTEPMARAALPPSATEAERISRPENTPPKREEPGGDSAETKDKPPRNSSAANPVSPSPREEPPPVLGHPDAPPTTERPAVFEGLSGNARHKGAVRAVCITSDSKRAFSLGVDNQINVWDLKTGQLLRTWALPAEEKLFALAVSADAKRAWLGGDAQVVHEMEFDEDVPLRDYRGHTGAIRSIVVSADGRRALSCGDDRSLWLWDLEKRAAVHHWIADEGAALFVQFAAAGKRALTWSADGTVRVWDVDAGQQLLKFKPASSGAALTAAAISRDGATIVLGFADGSARLYDYNRKVEIARMEAHSGAVHTVTFSPDGRFIITVGGVDKSQTTFLWHVEQNEPRCISFPLQPIAPMALTFTPESRRLLAGGKDGSLRVWEISGDWKSALKATAAKQSGGRPQATTADVIVEMTPANPPGRAPQPAAANTSVRQADPKPAAPKPATPALPDERAVTEAVKGIHETYKDDYTRLRTNKDAETLAAKLLAEGQRLQGDPIQRFALFCEARDLAARGAALALCLQVVEAMARHYPLNVLEAKRDALQQAGKSLETPAAAQAFLEVTLPLLRDAQANDNYAVMAPLVPPARQAAHILRDDALAKSTDRFLTQFERLRKHYEAIEPAVRTLKERPEDAEANRAVGEFLCFSKHEWDKGLLLLSKAGDSPLAAAARKELAKPADPADWAALGDAWWKLAADHGEFRAAISMRAYRWYARTLMEPNGKDQERIEKRVLEVTKLHPELRSAWGHLDLAVARATVLGDLYLHLGGGSVLPLKKKISGPFEITVELRANKKPPRFEFLFARDIRVLWDNTDKLLVARRPANLAEGLIANLNFIRPFTFTPNEWYKFTCRLTDEGMTLAVNEVPISQDPSKYNLSRPQTIQIKSTEEALEIRSVTVKPIKP
jgi:WD40 repeat protein